ncbi:MAG: S1 RNA-binding domain-containing protein [gamma proteobacterium endosymbiont of Lamellibrachia anaximandri]|nr:S1 RNA-binding domain-containing protein [gamma proteobacterium endosymbiont of Lamellibrachia anaximandri]
MEFDIATIFETKPWLGKIVPATVSHIDKYYAFLSIHDLPVTDKAYLHVSQFSEKYTNSLTDELEIGQKLEVYIIRFNRKKESWEVSLKLAHYRQATAKDIEIKTIAKGTISNISADRIGVDVNGVLAFISSTESALLIESELYSVGDQIDVKIISLSSHTKAYTCTHSGAVELSSEIVIDIAVLHIEQDVKINEDGKHSIWTLYGYTPEGLLVGSKIEKIANPQNRLLPGAKLQAKVIRKGKSVPWLHWVQLSEKLPLTDEYTIKPKFGDHRIGTVHTVIGYGAFLSVWDGMDSFLHRKSIINDDTPDLYKYIDAGDRVEIEVKEDPDGKRPFSIHFVRMVERAVAELEREEKFSLFDLSSKPSIGKTGGFIRSARFKSKTLESFSHTCIFCGESQIIGTMATAAEAAHIVPRSKRGMDDVANGACMCKLHHWAFDRGFIGVSQNKAISISNLVRDSQGGISDALAMMEGEEIFWPDSLEFPVEAFAWHERNVFRVT